MLCKETCTPEREVSRIGNLPKGPDVGQLVPIHHQHPSPPGPCGEGVARVTCHRARAVIGYTMSAYIRTRMPIYAAARKFLCWSSNRREGMLAARLTPLGYQSCGGKIDDAGTLPIIYRFKFAAFFFSFRAPHPRNNQT
jgi:hypothetical protein